MNLSKTLLIAFGCVGLIAAVFFALHIYSSAEVLAKGELLPYVKGYTIYKIRVLGRYEFFAEPDYRLSEDAVNTYILVGIAFISLTFAILLRKYGGGAARKVFACFLCLFLAMNFLAADEFLGIHETLGHNMQFLTDWIPISDRPDDILILCYLIPAAVFFLFFFRTLLASKKAIGLFGAALLVFGLGAVADSFNLVIEEVCEVIASILIIVGVLFLGLHHLSLWIEPKNETATGESQTS